jgi:hypothetical protein
MRMKGAGEIDAETRPTRVVGTIFRVDTFYAVESVHLV